jgi:hypothetical protein
MRQIDPSLNRVAVEKSYSWIKILRSIKIRLSTNNSLALKTDYWEEAIKLLKRKDQPIKINNSNNCYKKQIKNS